MAYLIEGALTLIIAQRMLPLPIRYARLARGPALLVAHVVFLSVLEPGLWGGVALGLASLAALVFFERSWLLSDVYRRLRR